jgi:predicted nucleic-acid-binding Zn-ribbon protein
MTESPGDKPKGYRLTFSVKCPKCGVEQFLYGSVEAITRDMNELSEFDSNFANLIEYVVCRNCSHEPMYIHVERRAMSDEEYERLMKSLKEHRTTETSLEAWQRQQRQRSENSDD